MVRNGPLLGFTALVLAAVAPMPGQAQSDPAAQALINRLLPSMNSRLRGIHVADEPAPPGPAAHAAASTGAVAMPVRPALAAATGARPVAQETTSEAPSASITVTFPSGSATLTREAEKALAPLGRALSSHDLAPYRFQIEGHTDTVGDDAQNQLLSERRAEAVRDYLVNSFSVDAARLQSRGLGASQLLVPTPPQTPELRNRRVQVVNLGS